MGVGHDLIIVVGRGHYHPLRCDLDKVVAAITIPEAGRTVLAHHVVLQVGLLRELSLTAHAPEVVVEELVFQQCWPAFKQVATGLAFEERVVVAVSALRLLAAGWREAGLVVNAEVKPARVKVAHGDNGGAMPESRSRS